MTPTHTPSPADTRAPLRTFVQAMTALVNQTSDEATVLQQARVHLSQLLRTDTWLDAAYAAPRTDRYAQYLLHCDPQERFSVVSFVWAEGQHTPVHNHTVWGLVGVLRGAERCEEFALVEGAPVDQHCSHLMHPGDIDAVSPTVGDWHRVSSAFSGGVTVSIHVYGGNIGATRRQRLTDLGECVDFISGYDNTVLPNLWNHAA